MNKLLLLLGLFGFAGVTLAEEPQVTVPPAAGTRPIDRFPQLDANSDGRLSRDEIAEDAALNGQFEALDKDRNGYINRDEFPRSNAAPARDLDQEDERVLPSREPAFPVWQFKPLIRC